jgi:hypothetical protein
LIATVDLHRADTNEPVAGVTLDFNHEVPETGVVSATLRIDGLDALRPGDYNGDIALRATRPNGQPMEVAIRPGATLPVSLKVARPLALVDTQLADFGSLLFDTSPNFRLDQELLLPVNFLGKRFRVSAALANSSCADLTLTAEEVRVEGGANVLPVRLRSPGPVSPGACSGAIQLSGPDADYDVFPQTLDWQLRVNDVEWSLVNGALNLGDLQDAGTRSDAQLTLRFNGKTPFLLQMVELNAEGDSPSGRIALSGEDLQMAPVEISGAASEAGVYEVPITLALQRALPRDLYRGGFFSGKVTLGIVGLPEKTQTLAISFRNPSLLQRYVAPVIVPVYARLPLALCAWPLTLFLLLVAVARVRGRDINDVEIDQAAVAPSILLPAQPLVDLGSSAEAASFANPTTLDAVWGNAEWGTAWGSDGGERPAASVHAGNGAGNGGDPWQSGW